MSKKLKHKLIGEPEQSPAEHQPFAVYPEIIYINNNQLGVGNNNQAADDYGERDSGESNLPQTTSSDANKRYKIKPNQSLVKKCLIKNLFKSSNYKKNILVLEVMN